MPDERGRCRVVDPSTSQAWSSASPVIVAPLTAWSQRALQMSTPIRDLHRVPHQGQTEQSSEMRSHPSTAPGNSSFRGVRSTPVRKASFGRRKCGLPACLPWGSFGEPPLLAFVGKSVLGVSPGEGGGFLLVRSEIQQSRIVVRPSVRSVVVFAVSPPLPTSPFHVPLSRPRQSRHHDCACRSA